MARRLRKRGAGREIESSPGERGVSPPLSRGEALRGAVRDVGGVLLSWACLIVVELAVIGVSCRGLFAGEAELALGRSLVPPIALAMLVPLAVAFVAVGHLAYAAGDRAHPRARVALALAACAGFASVGVGITQGRHFASPVVRVPFVVALAAIAFSITYRSAPRVRRVFADGRAGSAALVLGVGGSALFLFADASVLPNLYPAFHALLFVLTLASAAITVLGWRSARPARVPEGELVAGCVGLVAALSASAYSPTAARRLASQDNLRIVLDEHAPILGRAVHVASWLSPPPRVGADDASKVAAPPVEDVPRALDWSRSDIVLVSIDALRADHLGAYGYLRPTTPNLDALAKESALFEHAYCPTPSTSYSVTSMMTGKSLRPIFALGLGKDSVTWATYLRRQGFKTAAFYPPAIFYIEEDRFTDLEKSGLGFEHRSAEFSSAEQKVEAVDKYLSTAGPEPLFIWVHFYEPHEPYVTHPGYEFGQGDKRAVDAYDSEVAYTDASVGALLRAVRARRQGHRLVTIVTADHGEEFGDHGGRYHGTTCYEEQVRVPLLVSGPGVSPRRMPTVVQTIDLLPTVLSAMGIPRPESVRGRDLGELLAGKAPADDPGLAYSETDDRTLLARGNDRLICARKIAACALYDVASDPEERVDRASREPEVARELRAMTVGVERDLGRHEASEVAWPDALRRGLQGEADAAKDVAALLGDANVLIRRKAAEVSFRLAASEAAPAVKAALDRDADEEVKRWAALALVRMGEAPSPKAEELVHDAVPSWRRAAALAFALRGDARGKEELEAWWRADGPARGRGVRIHTPDAADLLHALSKIRDADAVPALVESLGYYPLRPRVAEALGEIGDKSAKAPLLSSFEKEKYEPARPLEAWALIALGAARETLPPLTLFAGLTDPMTEAVSILRDAKLLDARSSGATFEPAAVDVDVEIAAPAGARSLRLWVLAAGEGGELSGKIDARELGTVTTTGSVHRVELQDTGGKRSVRVRILEPKGVRAVWIVPWPTELRSAN
jgi:arylsulfatase A-like enzyme